MKLKHLAILFLMLVMTFTSSCGQKPASSTSTDTTPKTTLVYGSNDYSSINPALYEHGEINSLIFSGLTARDKDNKITAGLAESWEYDKDTFVYTFHLRKGVLWHDGKPFTSKDVKFTLEKLWLNPAVPFFQRANVQDISRVDVVDDLTVRIVTKVPFVTLPVMLGYLANILPEHVLGTYSVEQLRNPVEFLRHPIGTGPFRFGEAVLGSHVRLVANEKYFLGRPKLDAVVFRVVADIEQQLAQLQTGQIDLMIIEPHQVPLVQKMPNVQIVDAPQVNYAYVGFNHKAEP